MIKQLRKDWPSLAFTAASTLFALHADAPSWVVACNGMCFGIVIGASCMDAHLASIRARIESE